MKTIIKYLLILICFSAKAQLQTETTTYSYDNLNRLVQVVFNDGSTHDYVYDNLGNRIQLDMALSIDEETLKNPITIYPNPTSNILNVELPQDFNYRNSTIQLFDINGKQISKKAITISDTQLNIDVHSLANGVYLVRLVNDNQQFSKLFIKK